ncbi:MAG: PAS domain-containing protein, partial [Verrucomicrobia bacterium]|nr:PAS domain-containing protein [Verrucomicrobiota bacterium]
FHYALKPTGYLMLGASETVGSFADLFALLNKRAKIYSKKSTHVRPTVVFGPTPLEPRAATASEPTAPLSVIPNLAEIQKQADRILLTHYSPAGVIVNKYLEVLQFRGRTGLYLEHAHGEASLNLLKMAREGLVIDLRTVVNKAIKQNTRVRQAGVHVKQNGHLLEVALEAIPYHVPPSSERFYLVLFQPAGGGTEAASNKGHRGDKAQAHRVTENAERTRLREELAATRESLQAIIEEQEATMEELRSANEEIMSSNEELQSTNEELETAKEELQSTNEELTTLNDELESRNTELEHVNNDLHNVLSSVNIPIIILGSDLRIRRFTGVAEKLLNLIPGDVGRPITDINLPLGIPELPRLVMDVIDNLAIRELELKDREGHWWSVRIRPYKTTDNKIDGAVLALLDIDLIKASAEQVSQGRAFTEMVINTVRRPALLLDKELTVQAANQRFYQTFQINPETTLNHRVYQLSEGQWDIPKLHTLLEEVLPRNPSFENFELEHNFHHLGRRKLRLDAHRFTARGDKHHLILLTIEDLGEPPSQ